MNPQRRNNARRRSRDCRDKATTLIELRSLTLIHLNTTHLNYRIYVAEDGHRQTKPEKQKLQKCTRPHAGFDTTSKSRRDYCMKQKKRREKREQRVKQTPPDHCKSCAIKRTIFRLIVFIRTPSPEGLWSIKDSSTRICFTRSLVKSNYQEKSK